MIVEIIAWKRAASLNRALVSLDGLIVETAGDR